MTKYEKKLLETINDTVDHIYRYMKEHKELDIYSTASVEQALQAVISSLKLLLEEEK